MAKFRAPPINKVEKCGLGNEVLKLSQDGLSNNKIAERLRNLTNISITSANIQSYLAAYKKRVNINRDIALKMDTQLKEADLQLLGRWEKIDSTLQKILDKATKLLADIEGKYYDNPKAKPNELHYTLRLIQGLLKDVSQINESRARIRGNIAPSVNINVTNIENQYNDLKHLIIKANEHFPGVLEWVETRAGFGD